MDARDTLSNPRVWFPESFFPCGPLAATCQELLVRRPRCLPVRPLLREVRHPLVEIQLDIDRSSQPLRHDHGRLQCTRHRRRQNRVDASVVGEAGSESVGFAYTF